MVRTGTGLKTTTRSSVIITTAVERMADEVVFVFPTTASEKAEKQMSSIEPIDPPNENGQESNEIRNENGNGRENSKQAINKTTESDNVSTAYNVVMTLSSPSSPYEEPALAPAPGAATAIAEGATYITTDDNLAYQPSEYELQRMERIRRNQEYLASLGLATLSKDQKKNSAKKQRKRASEGAPPPVEKRPRSSRLQGKEFNFNVDAMFMQQIGLVPPIAQIDKNGSIDNNNVKEPHPPEASATVDTGEEGLRNQPSSQPQESSEKKIRYRDFVSRELRRMQTERRIDLRIAERNIKTAEKELRIAEREYSSFERKKKREEEATNLRGQFEEFRRLASIRQVVQRLQGEREMVQRVSGMTSFFVQVHRHIKLIYLTQLSLRLELSLYFSQDIATEVQKHCRAVEVELRHVLTTFPKALQSASTILDEFVASNIPKRPQKDKNQQRQSAFADGRIQSPHHATKKAKKPEHPTEFRLVEGLRHVNGSLSPDIAKLMDRSWLEMDAPVKATHYQTFVPQVDDIVM